MNYNANVNTPDFSQLKYFKILSELKVNPDRLLADYETLVQKVPLDPVTGQICLTHSSLDYDGKDLFYEGCGSLTYQWSKDPYAEDGSLKKRKVQLKDSDFTIFNEELKNTYLYEVYTKLSASYRVGRLRFFQLLPKKCMSWHSDTEPRIHMAVVTDPGCRMVIEEECIHMPADGSVYYCDTGQFHTAFNGSHKCKRIHLVAGILPMPTEV